MPQAQALGGNEKGRASGQVGAEQTNPRPVNSPVLQTRLQRLRLAEHLACQSLIIYTQFSCTTPVMVFPTSRPKMVHD